MYIPGSFRISDQDVLFDFIEQNSFAVITSMVDGSLFASHLVLQLDREGKRLRFHMARANPHWQACDGNTEALVIVSGGHAYISPAWYSDRRAVPTWNYQAVHIKGIPRLVEDQDAIRAQMAALVAAHEGAGATGWSLEEAGDLADALLGAIVVLEMDIAGIEGKYKLSQNRPAADRAGVIAGLERQGDAGSGAIAAAMRRIPDDPRS
jgi:transcriptional regulator